MGKFESVGVSQKTPIPTYPHTCQQCGVSDIPAVVLISVNVNGRIKVGAFGEFGYTKGGEHYLHDSYSYDGWRTWCADCHSGEPRNSGPSRFTPEQCRKAWMWMFSKIEDFPINLGRVEPLTHEQEEWCMRIVNEEARRTGNPDAIPDEFKLVEVWGDAA